MEDEPKEKEKGNEEDNKKNNMKDKDNKEKDNDDNEKNKHIKDKEKKRENEKDMNDKDEEEDMKDKDEENEKENDNQLVEKLKGEKNDDDEKLEKLDIKPSYITIEDFTKNEPKLIEIFKKFKNKLTEPKSGLFICPKNYNFQSSEYKDFFIYENKIPLKDENKYQIIYDCCNFISYSKEEASISSNKFNYIHAINNYTPKLTEKGTLIVLIDQFHLEYFFPNFILALGTNYKTKLFINFYFIDFHNFLFLVTMQRMGKSDQSINLNDTKVLMTDYFSNLHSKMLCSTKLGEINIYLKEQVSKIQSYHLQCQLNYSRLKVLHPGEYMQMRLKTSPLNADITFIITIYDYSQNEDQKNKRTFGVAISYPVEQEFVFAKNFSFDNICQQLNAARLIVIEPSLLNPVSVREIGLEFNNEIQLMKPDGFNGEVMIKVWDDDNPKILVYDDGKYLIRDNEDKSFVVRQLLYVNDKNMESIVQSKIRIKYATKSKINKPAKGFRYYTMETNSKLKSKGVIECIDELNIFGFYEKSLICMAFFMNLEILPKNTIKIMDIGAGIGVLSFYFYLLFKGCCEIDNIEKNKSMYEIGMKYFGLKNYDTHRNRVNFYFEDIESCLKKMTDDNEKKENKYENKIGFYDLMFNEINDIVLKEETTPPKEHFSNEFLGNIVKLLKPCGIYAVNIMSKSYKSLYDCFIQLEKHFSSIFSISSQNGVCTIFFCFKEKFDTEKYGIIFNKNKKIIEKNEVVEFPIIKPILNEVISRITSMDEEAKKDLEEKSKKI